jgi:hypothetical protein
MGEITIENLTILAEDGPFRISLRQGHTLHAPIRWPFLEVWMSSDFESDDLGRYSLPDYVGSTHFLGDEGFVFDPETKLLTSVYLRVPEVTASDEMIVDRWRSVPEVKGLPVAVTSRKAQINSPSDIRCLSGNGKHLISVSENAILPVDAVRVTIHERMAILFQGGVYCGFMLEHPIWYLDRFSAEPRSNDSECNEEILLQPLLEYLQTVQEKNWELLENRDEVTKETLMGIVDALSPHTEVIQALVLKERCQEILAEYF